MTLYGKIKATFENIARLDSRMRVPRDRNSRFYFSFNIYRDITRHWTVSLPTGAVESLESNFGGVLL